MSTAPEMVTFQTEELLHEYAESLNERGLTPDVAIMDSAGHSVLACRTAPGGDGWGFAYYAPYEDGFMHCCNCSECPRSDCYASRGEWKPAFPVFALVHSRCNHNGGHAEGSDHECRCFRLADHSDPWGYNREHGCRCGAMWNGDAAR